MIGLIISKIITGLIVGAGLFAVFYAIRAKARRDAEAALKAVGDRATIKALETRKEIDHAVNADPDLGARAARAGVVRPTAK